MKRVCDLLHDKGRDVWALPPDATVYEAIDQMAQKGVGALLVMEGERLVGIISERDYARKVILKGKASREIQVREIMSHPVICARLELTIEETMALMTDNHDRHHQCGLSGHCCNVQATAPERHNAGVASDCNLDRTSDEMELADNLTHPQ